MSELYILFHESAYFQILTPVAILLAIFMLTVSIVLCFLYIYKKKKSLYRIALVLFLISLPIIIDGFVWRNLYSVVSAKTTEDMLSTCKKISNAPLKMHKALYYKTCSTFLVGLNDEKSVEYYNKYFEIVKKHRLNGEKFPGTVIMGLQYIKLNDYEKAIDVFKAYDYSDEKIMNLCKIKKSGCDVNKMKKLLK